VRLVHAQVHPRGGRKRPSARLVRMPGQSPYHPAWEVTVGRLTFYVTQEGAVLGGTDRLRRPPTRPRRGQRGR
jgi:hypothetical protein